MRVQFTPLGCSGEARPDETLLDVARRVAVPLGNSCGGIGICARCRVRVVTGGENLAGPTSVESRVGLERGLAPDERLACQAIVNGNCTVTTAYW
jgi:ferredoxin